MLSELSVDFYLESQREVERQLLVSCILGWGCGLSPLLSIRQHPLVPSSTVWYELQFDEEGRAAGAFLSQLSTSQVICDVAWDSYTKTFTECGKSKVTLCLVHLINNAVHVQQLLVLLVYIVQHKARSSQVLHYCVLNRRWSDAVPRCRGSGTK